MAGSLCPVMLDIFGKRVAVENTPHHTRGRLGPLLFDDRTFLAVSAEGHTFIHNNIELARKHGWYAPAGQWNTPLP